MNKVSAQPLLSPKHDEILAHFTTQIEEATGMKCSILLTEKADELLHYLTLEELHAVIEEFLPPGVDSLAERVRKRELVNLRKMFCLLATNGNHSLRNIGIYLNNRDHATVIHNIEKAKLHLDAEPTFRRVYNLIRKALLSTYSHKLDGDPVNKKRRKLVWS